MKKSKLHGYEKEFWEEYERRVLASEGNGLTRSDAQGVVDTQEEEILSAIKRNVEDRK